MIVCTQSSHDSRHRSHQVCLIDYQSSSPVVSTEQRQGTWVSMLAVYPNPNPTSRTIKLGSFERESIKIGDSKPESGSGYHGDEVILSHSYHEHHRRKLQDVTLERLIDKQRSRGDLIIEHNMYPNDIVLEFDGLGAILASWHRGILSSIEW